MELTSEETAALRLNLAQRGWDTEVTSHFEDDDDFSNLKIRISKYFHNLSTGKIETTAAYNKIGETFLILNEYIKTFENHPIFIPDIRLHSTENIVSVKEKLGFSIDFDHLNDEYHLASLMRQKDWRYSDRIMVHGNQRVKYRRISFDRWTWHGAIANIALFDIIDVNEPTLPFAMKLAKKGLKAYSDFPKSIPKVLSDGQIVEDVTATEANKDMKHRIS